MAEWLRISDNFEMMTRREWLRSNRFEVAVGALTVLAIALRFYLIGSKTVWLDEAFSIWLARQPLWEMYDWLVRIDQHPPDRKSVV